MTRNQRDFMLVPGLELENWAIDRPAEMEWRSPFHCADECGRGDRFFDLILNILKLISEIKNTSQS